MRLFLYEHLTATCTPDHPLYGEGQTMREALWADFAALPEVELVPTIQVADAVLLIAPETDGILAQLADDALARGKVLLGPTPEAIRLTSDKYVLAQHWQIHGVPTPRTWLLPEAPPGSRIVKPRDGAGSQATSVREIGSHETDTNFIAQQFVHGRAASVAFLIGPNVCVPLVPCAQHIEPATFAYQGGYTPLEEPWASAARAVAQRAVACVPGLHGYVGVDVVIGVDESAWAIEINPRLTTSYAGLRALCADNLAEAWLQVLRGEPVALTWHPDRVTFTSDGQVTRRA